jgi:hypothetical protein
MTEVHTGINLTVCPVRKSQLTGCILVEPSHDFSLILKLYRQLPRILKRDLGKEGEFP